MTVPFQDLGQLIPSNGGSQGFESLVQGGQDDLCVRLPSLCTDGVHAVVGQHDVNQAAQVQVMHNAPVREHVLIAQSQVAFQFLEQHLDAPAALVDRHDRAGIR